IGIVEIGGAFFNVVPLKLADWLIIIGGTSVVLWVGELLRLLNALGRKLSKARAARRQTKIAEELSLAVDEENSEETEDVEE
ncbi:MAG: hypothetical protein K2I91_03485, partial [Muribaculaceae bacterium]|nr:hypothetical protein [Muribaculaceae bacterium]